MLELLLVRHGETDWNRGDRVMGRQSIPLNARGREQARLLAEYLRGIPLSAIFTSPVARARETTQFLATISNGCPVISEDDLAEIDYGRLDGHSFHEVAQHYRQQCGNDRDHPASVVFPDGESLQQAADRVGRVIERVQREHQEGKVLLVSHADVIKLALFHIFHVPIAAIRHVSIDNAALILIRFTADVGPRLIFYNPANGFGNDL